MITTITTGLIISSLIMGVIYFPLTTGRKISPLERLMTHNKEQEQVHKDKWTRDLIDRYIRPSRGEEGDINV